MSSKYGGFIFLVDESERAWKMKDYIDHFKTFTDTISAPDWSPKQNEIALISLGDDEIHYAAICKRGRRVATQKYQIKFTDILVFEEPLDFTEISDQLDNRIRGYFFKASTGIGSRIPPKTWESVIEAIKILRPEYARELNALEEIRKPKMRFWDKSSTDIVSQERDAVNLALRLAGFDSNQILEWSQEEGAPAPFLTGLKEFAMLEDKMIEHDAKVFGDWEQIRNYQVGASLFSNGTDRLTVMNVNRHKIEETLGVDLLYYFEKYNSYVMVQYKRMTKEGTELGYRPLNDKSYRDEIARMENFKSTVGVCRATNTLMDYRLNPEFFFFKLCPSINFEPQTADMIKGMYFPHEYWVELMKSEQIRGARGGICIRYTNVDRYLGNSLFIDLVQAGWLGSKIEHTDAITQIIRSSLEAGNSLILAAKRSWKQ